MPDPVIVQTGNEPVRPVVVLLGNQPRPAAVTLAGELVHVAEPATAPAPRVKRPYTRKPKPVDGDAAENEQEES